MQYRWYHKLTGVLYVVLCFEIGLFLIFFPWSDYWKLNMLANFSPEWGVFWLNPYFRGAISGLGLINVYYSVVEAFRLRRFSISPHAAVDDDETPNSDSHQRGNTDD